MPNLILLYIYTTLRQDTNAGSHAAKPATPNELKLHACVCVYWLHRKHKIHSTTQQKPTNMRNKTTQALDWLDPLGVLAQAKDRTNCLYQSEDKEDNCTNRSNTFPKIPEQFLFKVCAVFGPEAITINIHRRKDVVITGMAINHVWCKPVNQVPHCNLVIVSYNFIFH